MKDFPRELTDNIDEIVEWALNNDQELVDGIKWLDGQAFKKGMTFYEMVVDVMYRHDIKIKAKEWMKEKNETMS